MESLLASNILTKYPRSPYTRDGAPAFIEDTEYRDDFVSDCMPVIVYAFIFLNSRCAKNF